MDRKLMTPHEAEIDRLLQVMAVLVEKLGGEVFVSRQELEAYFDVPVLTRYVSKDYIRLTVGEVGASEDIVIPNETDLPEETPQP